MIKKIQYDKKSKRLTENEKKITERIKHKITIGDWANGRTRLFRKLKKGKKLNLNEGENKNDGYQEKQQSIQRMKKVEK